jgi:hypothetical protein
MRCLERNGSGEAFGINGNVWHGEGHDVVKDGLVNDGARKANEMYSLTGSPPIFPASRHQQVVAAS